MISVKEMKCIKRLAETEKQLVNEYDLLYHEAKEPQLKSDLQSICASHKNHLSDLLKLLEENQ